MPLSRRGFLSGVAASTLGTLTRRSPGASFGFLPGLQLYSVYHQMAQDLDGTLTTVREAGFVEVESAALPKKPASVIRTALDKAGLRCVSAHRSFIDVTEHLEETIAYEKTIGVSYIICPGPGRKNPQVPVAKQDPLTIEDWQYNAQLFNEIGEKLKKADISFGYHTHWAEFEAVNGKIPLEELLRICEPDNVTFEMDCGWVKLAGRDPVEVMKSHPYRFSMFHVKDFYLPKTTFPVNIEGLKLTELGRGDIDYKPIFEQALKNQRIKFAFVEQEGFDIPWKESLKVDADYLNKLLR